MASQKTCRQCKAIYEGSACPHCGSQESADAYKGKVVVLKPEASEVAKNLKISKKGSFAVKLG